MRNINEPSSRKQESFSVLRAGKEIVSTASLTRDFFKGYNCASQFIRKDKWTRALRRAFR